MGLAFGSGASRGQRPLVAAIGSHHNQLWFSPPRQDPSHLNGRICLDSAGLSTTHPDRRRQGGTGSQPQDS